MADRRIQSTLILLIGVNLLLLAVGTVLRTVIEPGMSPTHEDVRGGKAVTGRLATRTEPYIVPKIDDAELDDLGREFERTRWGDMFSPDRKDGENFWKSKRPENYLGKPDFVLGIPTIVREGQGYLFDTLRSLFNNRNGYSSVVVVIFVGDENRTVVDCISSDLKSNFSSEFADGLIHVIYPPKDYYPDWKVELRGSFGDSFQRVKWRSKQNVDQLYLMMYSYFLQPKYYLMLEDDVLAAGDYLKKIYLDAESKSDKNYVLISYCQLGAIGKLFRRELLPSFASYISLFWSDKPLDWLLLDYERTRACGLDQQEKDCSKTIREIEIIYKPSLFQHIGTKSSFPGKIQKLKDKSFKP